MNSELQKYNGLNLKVRDVPLNLSPEEQNVIFTAYDYGATDYGLRYLTDEKRQLIDIVIAKIKDQVHP